MGSDKSVALIYSTQKTIQKSFDLGKAVEGGSLA